jgi:outer membrane lipoprotein-sorting protein
MDELRLRSVRRCAAAVRIAVCVGLARAPFAAAAAPAADPLRAALAVWQEGLQQVSSIASDFVQEKRLALFRDPLAIRGRLYLSTDGRFAWETHAPVRYKLVVADGRIRQWDDETGRVQTISMRDNPAASAVHAQMSVWFSGRYEELADTYDIELGSERPVAFVFRPVAGTPAADYLQTVEVQLRPDGRYLDQVRIFERSGDQTTISFVNTALNPVLPDATWDVRRMAADLPAPPSAEALSRE